MNVSFFLPMQTREGKVIPGVKPTKDINFESYLADIREGTWQDTVINSWGDAGYKSRGFWAVFEDGSGAVDFSYIKALESKSRSLDSKKKADVVKAMRAAIVPIIEAARSKVKYGIQKCPVTGVILIPSNTHIDHYNKEFAWIADSFIQEKGLNYLFSYTAQNLTSCTSDFFTNDQIISEFIRFHNQNTHLRAVTKEANTKILRLA